jgi:hypothetical protein
MRSFAPGLVVQAPSVDGLCAFDRSVCLASSTATLDDVCIGAVRTGEGEVREDSGEHARSDCGDEQVREGRVVAAGYERVDEEAERESRASGNDAERPEPPCRDVASLLAWSLIDECRLVLKAIALVLGGDSMFVTRLVVSHTFLCFGEWRPAVPS